MVELQARTSGVMILGFLGPLGLPGPVCETRFTRRLQMVRLLSPFTVEHGDTTATTKIAESDASVVGRQLHGKSKCRLTLECRPREPRGCRREGWRKLGWWEQRRLTFCWGRSRRHRGQPPSQRHRGYQKPKVSALSGSQAIAAMV